MGAPSGHSWSEKLQVYLLRLVRNDAQGAPPGRHKPPMLDCFSRTIGYNPIARQYFAVHSPLIPAPIITTRRGGCCCVWVSIVFMCRRAHKMCCSTIPFVDDFEETKERYEDTKILRHVIIILAKTKRSWKSAAEIVIKSLNSERLWG